MKTRLFAIPLLVLGVTLSLVHASAARGAKAIDQALLSSPVFYDTRDIPFLEGEAQLEGLSGSFINQDEHVYLPIVQQDLPPCYLPPTLIGPPSGAVLDTLIPRLDYIQNTNPISYTIVSLADNPGFNSPLLFYLYGRNTGPKQVRLSYNLEEATKYYWKAMDHCSSVDSSPSPAFTFTTGSGGVILPVPTLISPISGTVGVGDTIMLNWNKVSGAVGYQIEHGIYSSGHALDITPANSFELIYLQPKTTYEWSVQAYNDYALGKQSSYWLFTTGSFTLQLQDTMSDLLSDPFTLFHPVEQTTSIIVQLR